MPEKNIDFNSINVGIGAVLLLVGSYVSFAIRSYTKDKDKDIKNLKEEIEKIEKDGKEKFSKLNELHGKHFEFEKEIKPDISELKANCKNLKEIVDKIDTEHRKNH